MKKIKLTIPEPCHENWDQMTQEDKGRYCQACRKTVIDFTAMSDRDLAQFFKKPMGGVCGRFKEEQLDKDILLPQKRIPWARYFFQIALPAFLMTLKATAQRDTLVGKVALICNKPLQPIQIKKDSSNEEEIRGLVNDNQGQPLSNVTVQIVGTKYVTATDSAGKFILKGPHLIGSEIMLSYIGFDAIRKTVNSTDFLTYTFNSPSTLGEVVIVGSLIRHTKRKDVPLIKRLIDSSLQKLIVFPNPLTLGGKLTMDSKKIPDGNYSMRIVDLSGNVMRFEKITLYKKIHLTVIQVRELKRGDYMLELLNEKTGKRYSEKFIII